MTYDHDHGQDDDDDDDDDDDHHHHHHLLVVLCSTICGPNWSFYICAFLTTFLREGAHRSS
jgi:hypothetical protein